MPGRLSAVRNRMEKEPFMQVTCDYCGTLFSDTEPACPNCGAPNANLSRTADKTPKTIEELQQWYRDRKLPPPETTRFFIGENYTGPKAFGIYEENGEFIVYKNKADGSRAVRYRGKDESYAVNELLMRLKTEILDQKANLKSGATKASVRSAPTPPTRRSRGGAGPGRVVGWVLIGLLWLGAMTEKAALTLALTALPIAALLIYQRSLKGNQQKRERAGDVFRKWFIWYVLAVVCFIAMISPSSSSGGPAYTPSYYSYNGDVYCSYGDDYYYYDGDDYCYIEEEDFPDEILVNPDAYAFYESDGAWDSDLSFFDSDAYRDNYDDYSSYDSYSSGSSSSWSSSSDSDYDWSWGSDSDSDWGSSDWDSGWDSDWGGSDWDSDW